METSPQTSNPQSAPNGYDDPVVATQAKNLTKAIFQHESNTNYNAVGDAGTSKGAGQWQAGTWKAQAKDVLGDENAPMTPENQSVVAQGTIRKLIKSGKNAAQIAAIWNSGNDQDWKNKVGTTTINGQQIAYNVPKYVKSVTDLYQQYKGQPQSSDTGLDTAQASTGAQQPESTLNKALDVGKSVGDFLFPAVGDVYHDVKGDNQKTALQQAGDVALTALPFIPGLGEVGEGARGAEAGVEGASLLGKVAASPVARNAAVGYGSGVAQNLSEGKGIGESLAPNVNTIGGGILGLGGGLAGKAVGGLLDTATGIPKNRMPGLSRISDPKLYDEYAKVGAARASDETNPSLLEHGIDYFKKSVDTIQKNLKDTQGEIGDAIKNDGAKPIKDVTPVLQSFKDNLGKYFAKDINISKNGAIKIENLPGRVKNTLDTEDETRVKETLAQVLSLRKDGNIQKTSDVISNLDDAINYGKKKYFGATDPLNGFLKQTRHDLNEVLKKSSDSLGTAKERASALHEALGEIEGAGGNNLQRGGLLLKRVLSGDQGKVPREVFDTIKKETGIDLQQHATLIRHFVDSLGDQSEKSALQRMLEESAVRGGTTLTDLGLRGGKSLLQSTVANPIKVGRRIVTGKEPYGILGSALRKGVPTKGLLTAARSIFPNQ